MKASLVTVKWTQERLGKCHASMGAFATLLDADTGLPLSIPRRRVGADRSISYVFVGCFVNERIVIV